MFGKHWSRCCMPQRGRKEGNRSSLAGEGGSSEGETHGQAWFNGGRETQKALQENMQKQAGAFHMFSFILISCLIGNSFIQLKFKEYRRVCQTVSFLHLSSSHFPSKSTCYQARDMRCYANKNACVCFLRDPFEKFKWQPTIHSVQILLLSLNISWRSFYINM